MGGNASFGGQSVEIPHSMWRLCLRECGHTQHSIVVWERKKGRLESLEMHQDLLWVDYTV